MVTVAREADGDEPATPESDSRRFSVWLKVMAEHADVTEASQLHAFLLEHGCQCTREAAGEWLSGTDPSFEKSRDIIRAFHMAFPELEVWEEYRRFVKGEPYMQETGSRPSHIGETLEQILKDTGLPPGLLD